MVNEPVGEIEDKRQGLLEPVTPFEKWKGARFLNDKYKKCPKCGNEIPAHFYFHKECGWDGA